LPRLVSETAPDSIVVTNLFRDQLDRYGELETTASHILRALTTPSPPLPIRGREKNEPCHRAQCR
jgi:hypothetical protein